MITREELSALVEQLSEDQLDLAFQRLRPLVKEEKQTNGSTQAITEEQTEFIIPYRPGRRINLPIRFPRRPSETVTMTIEEASPQEISLFQRFHDNIEWWNRHHRRIIEDTSLFNQFVAISEGEVFAAPTYLAAIETVSQHHPGDAPYIFFLYPPGH